MRAVASIALLFCFCANANAQMQLEEMTLAQGLGEILQHADNCQYTIDDGALERYYVEKKLDRPEILSFISSVVSMGKFGDKPTSSDCTLARTTARSIGILAK